MEAIDFTNKLLQRKPINRLGFNGAEEVREHPWFKDYNWEKLLSKDLVSPYIPNVNLERNRDKKKIITIMIQKIRRTMSMEKMHLCSKGIQSKLYFKATTTTRILIKSKTPHSKVPTTCLSLNKPR